MTLDYKIANLTALERNINNTTSIGDLMAIMDSFHPMFGMGDRPMMHHIMMNNMMIPNGFMINYFMMNDSMRNNSPMDNSTINNPF